MVITHDWLLKTVRERMQCRGEWRCEWKRKRKKKQNKTNTLQTMHKNKKNETAAYYINIQIKTGWTTTHIYCHSYKIGTSIQFN